jgi:hypothetical protein
VFFIEEVLLLLGLLTIKLTTEGLEVKFFITEIMLFKGSLYRGFSVIVTKKHQLRPVSGQTLGGQPGVVTHRVYCYDPITTS